MTAENAAPLTNTILTNEDIFPGMVVKQTYVNWGRSGQEYIGIVTDQRCPNNCGYLVAYVTNGVQCSASMTGNPKVSEVVSWAI